MFVRVYKIAMTSVEKMPRCLETSALSESSSGVSTLLFSALSEGNNELLRCMYKTQTQLPFLKMVTLNSTAELSRFAHGIVQTHE